MTYAWFDVTGNAGIARIMHMSYRSKTYTWNDIILVKRSMIGVFFSVKFHTLKYQSKQILRLCSVNSSPFQCILRSQLYKEATQVRHLPWVQEKLYTPYVPALKSRIP